MKRAAEFGQDLATYDNQWGKGGLPALVLETAYWWAEELAQEGSATQRVQALASDVQRLDREIATAAARLRDALQRKDSIAERGISTRWAYPGLDLASLLWVAVNRFPPFAYRIERPLQEALLLWRQASVADKPQLADVLAVLCEGRPGPLDATFSEDRAALALPPGSAAGGMAASVRMFFAQLDDQDMFDLRGRRLRPIEWLTPKGIVTLLKAVTVPIIRDLPISEEQIKKLRRRYLAEQGKAERT